MLTAEKMHLLLTREDGSSAAGSHHGVALAAAALADLRRAGVVDVEDAPAARARVLVTSGGLTDDAVLDALLPQVDGLAGQKVVAVVGKGRPKARRAVVDRLTRTGELIEHAAFLNTRHVPASPETRRALAAGLTEAARDGVQPSDEDRLLLGVLHHLNVLRGLAPAVLEGTDRRALGRHVESLTREDPLVQAVRASVSTIAAAGAAAL